jgi:regulator of cell morphogenesis and NO signaling
MTINPTTLVSEIVTAVPSSVRVFERYGVDFCCGGKRPLAMACEERGLSFDAILQEIEQSAAVIDDRRDWSAAPLRELTAHIVTTYHQALRKELPRLEALLARVVKAHRAKAPELLSHLGASLNELSADLLVHMQKEEAVLFPAIVRLEVQGAPGLPLDAPVRVMEDEHDRAGALLGALREVTDNFEPPGWACATVRALYAGLTELESEMHMHVHLENNVLFPRALALASGRTFEQPLPAAGEFAAGRNV